MRTYKKVFILIILSITTCIGLGQNTSSFSNEISVSYGIGSSPQIGFWASQLTLLLAAEFVEIVLDELGHDVGEVLDTDLSLPGAISIRYHRYMADRWTLGAQLGLEQFKNQMTIAGGGSGLLQINQRSFMAHSSYSWIHEPKFRLYSGLYAGLGLKRTSYTSATFDEANTSPVFAYHANIIGARFGKNIGFFVEGGFGWNGLLSAGISGAF